MSFGNAEGIWLRLVNLYSAYYSDVAFRRNEQGQPGAEMKDEARVAWTDLNDGYDAHTLAVAAANDVRDIQTADFNFEQVVAGLWTP